MKKYRVSKAFNAIYACGLVFLLPVLLVFIWGYMTYKELYMLIIGIFLFIGLVQNVYYLFFTSIGCKFSFDENGITMYVPFTKYHHAWSELIRVDIISVPMNSVGAKKLADAYVVYFETKMLTLEERKDFMGKGRKDLNKVAWFQYRKIILDEIVQYVPEKYANELKEKQNVIESNMNLVEQLYNR